jgi:mono/diheme cytochrome c family protein
MTTTDFLPRLLMWHRRPDLPAVVAVVAVVSLMPALLIDRSARAAELVSAPAQALASSGPDYQRDVQPILAEHCGHCHGVDEQSRKGDLRLDIRQNALEGGESGQPAIVPGKADESELVSRILSDDPDTIMPPPHEKKPLAAAQIATLKAWITAGAKYDPHWAFVLPQRPAVPAVAAGTSPIDAIVASHLAAKGLAPAPEADPTTLCRRVYLDLIGLPPSPEQLAAFEADGYEKTVDALLASDRYGEKWARHWLDLARYSDTNGYEKDHRREMWIWRDWVIAAFNRDMPYDQFVVEQIAGDLLPNATQEQVVATGFLRNSAINEEGAIIAEEFRMVEMFDRIDCLGKAVLGLTTQCAQCHTHKFDPITHDEYYGLFAFLNNTYEARSYVYTPEQLAAIDDIRRQLAAADEKARTQRPGWQQEVAVWEQKMAAGLVAWTPVEMTEMSSSGLLTHPTQLPDKTILMLGHWDKEMIFESKPDLRGATGLQLEALTHGDLFMQGPGREGAWGVEELKCSVKKPGGEKWEPLSLVNATADFSVAERIETRPASPDGKTPEKKIAHGPVAKLIDGDIDSAWESDRGHIVRHQPSVAVVQFEKPLDLPEGTEFKVAVRMAGSNSRMLACCRVSLTTAPEPAAPPIDHAAILAIRTSKERRTAADEAAIFEAWRKSMADLTPIDNEIAALWKKMPQPPTTVLHMAERPHAQHRTTHLLDRGTWNQPLREIGPHVPAALHPFPANAPRNRLGFARWLVDPQSPLTARVAVNRIWQTLFGTGLVETSDDFGTRSPVPEYRDILDWLSVDFVEHGWSQKQLIREIVNSKTYRQSSRVTSESLAHDPGNRLLARGPRFRVDAEVVRDIALAVSGLITQKAGGPGVIPPVPQNVLDYNYHYPDFWKPAEGPERYRRAVYLFRKRSMPDPMMSSFDAPNGDLSCARRLRSNTPLAALAGLNEPVFVEAARALALRTLREGGSDDTSRGRYAFFLCTSRPPTDDEMQALLAFVAAQRKKVADGWTNAREVTTGDGEKLPGLPGNATPQDAAAWTLAARVLLNLDETLTKN